MKLFLKQLTEDFEVLFLEGEDSRTMIQSKVFRAAIAYVEYYLKTYGKEATIQMVKKSVDNIDIVLELLEKELTFNPVKMLGIILRPSMLITIMTTIIATGVTFYEFFIL